LKIFQLVSEYHIGLCKIFLCSLFLILVLETGFVTRSKGSSYIEIGNTKVICAWCVLTKTTAISSQFFSMIALAVIYLVSFKLLLYFYLFSAMGQNNCKAKTLA